MTLRIYQVDAFHHEVLRGNPAAVIPLATWLPDGQLQAIARENNLSETVYFLPAVDGQIPLRWFTPNKEVRLCGHATLATAHVLLQEMGLTQAELSFQTLSGTLTVARKGDGYQMNFPADFGQEVPVDKAIQQAIGTEVTALRQGKDDLLCIVKDQAAVAQLQPDLTAISQLPHRGVIVSAPGDAVDFVSRCFYPAYGINEDPVTGSAHTLMTPYWSKHLGKKELTARQISQREGILAVALAEDRVLLSGEAVTYLRGEVYV
ncbi:MAG: PhzF family phenazine biosynthesis protein [Bacteroidota bacterium]